MDLYLVTNRKLRGAAWTYFRTDNGQVTLMARKGGASGFDPPDFAVRKSAKTFIHELAERARQVARGGNHAPLVVAFIHGYNTGVHAAAERTLAIGRGLEANGVRAVMVCFSWPSDAKLPNYLQDRDDARLSYPAVVNILNALRTYTDFAACEVNLCLVAHSMGALVVREGLGRFAPQAGSPTDLPLFAETVLVAPDIDHNSFAVPGGSGLAVCALSRRVTVYYNRWDNVLAVSQDLKNNGSARLGRSGPNDYAALHPKVMAVNCSEIIRPRDLPGPVTREREATEEAHSGYFLNDLFYRDLSYTLLSTDRAVIPTRRLDSPFVKNSALLQQPSF